MISVFGPYIIGPIRLDQIVIYILLIPIIYLYSKISLKSLQNPLSAFLLLLIIWTSISSIIQVINPINHLNEVDNIIQPFIVNLLIIYLLNKIDYSTTVKIFSKVLIFIILLFSIHSLLVIYTIINLDISYLSIFHSSTMDDIRGTVATRSFSNFRFTGIFNQPLESGFGYSIALYSWEYSKNSFSSNSFKYLSLILIFVGGIASVSKIFIFFIIVYIIIKISKRIINNISLSKYRIQTFRIIIPSILVPILIYLLSVIVEWSGLDRLFNLLSFFQADDPKQMLGLLTGGRFTGELSEGTIIPVFLKLLYENPLLGNGFEKIPIVDNAYLEMQAYGGIILLSSFIYFVLSIFLKSFIYRNDTLIIRFKYIHLFALVLITSLGAPVITLNRVSVLFIIIFSFLIEIDRKK